MNFYKALEGVLTASNPKDKIEKFERFYSDFNEDKFSFENIEAKVFDAPSYKEFCKIVSPRDVPKRGSLETKNGQANLLHAIAHIEYNAIDLALDAVYRFQSTPIEFKKDWLEVAEDEIRHFLLIEEILNKIGSSYGELEVHDALFEASFKTNHSL